MKKMMTRSNYSIHLRLAVFGAIAVLVAGLENNDLVFDQESTLPVDITLEYKHRDSFFHSIWNWMNFYKTNNFPSSKFVSSDQFDKSINRNIIFNTDNRQKRNIRDNNRISSEHVSYIFKKSLYKDNRSIEPKLLLKYYQGDDEDELGSGELDIDKEIEGSANSIDFSMTPTMPINHKKSVIEPNLVDESNNYDEKNIYRISMIIKEPYREEFERRDNDKFQKFAENFTKTIEKILHQNLNKDHRVTFVKMENAPDSFESHVHLDVHTMSTETSIRNILEKHLNTYYSFGKFTVNPLTFRLRVVLDCQQGEISCDISRCILQIQRCDFKSDCEDGSDEVDCKYPININTAKEPDVY